MVQDMQNSEQGRDIGRQTSNGRRRQDARIREQFSGGGGIRYVQESTERWGWWWSNSRPGMSRRERMEEVRSSRLMTRRGCKCTCSPTDTRQNVANWHAECWQNNSECRYGKTERCKYFVRVYITILCICKWCRLVYP